MTEPEIVTPAVTDTETVSTQDRPQRFAEEPKEPQFYVHLADGSVLRCNESDVPNDKGSNAPNGHWQRGNKVYQVIGVYPVENETKEG